MQQAQTCGGWVSIKHAAGQTCEDGSHGPRTAGLGDAEH